MTIECWISVLELALKVVYWWQVIIFLRKIYRVMADTEKVLDEALAELGLGEDQAGDSVVLEHRDSLIGLAQSGLLHKIGIKKTESQLVSMSDADVEKTYSEYQRRYTSCVSDDVVSNLLYGYASICHWLAPGTEKEKLAKELTDNFVIEAEVKKQIGQLGISLSPWLAIANAAVITARNVDLKPKDSDIPSQSSPSGNGSETSLE